MPFYSIHELIFDFKIQKISTRNTLMFSISSTYSLAGALLLSGKYMNDWWEITLSIFLWMSLSFMVSFGNMKYY